MCIVLGVEDFADKIGTGLTGSSLSLPSQKKVSFISFKDAQIRSCIIMLQRITAQSITLLHAATTPQHGQSHGNELAPQDKYMQWAIVLWSLPSGPWTWSAIAEALNALNTPGINSSGFYPR